MTSRIILSPTRVRRWVRCKRSYYWRYNQHLVRMGREIAPTLGLIVGGALAGYYSKGERDQGVIEGTLKLSISRYKPKPDVDKNLMGEWEKVKRTATHLLSTYHEWASSRDDFKVIHIELPQQIKLAPRVSLLAIPDTIVAQDSETNMVLEHKVRYKYRPGDFGIDYQSVGSCLVSNSIGTLYNILDYRKSKFYREPIVRSDHELNYFREMFIHIGEDILSSSPDMLYPMPFKRCTCEYWELCNGEMQGLDLEDIISELYQRTTGRSKEIEKAEEEVTDG